MTTIHLPDEVGQIVAKTVKAAGYKKMDDYIKDVLLAQTGGVASAKLEAELLKGMDSPLVPMNAKMWRDLAGRVHKRRKAKAGK